MAAKPALRDGMQGVERSVVIHMSDERRGRPRAMPLPVRVSIRWSSCFIAGLATDAGYVAFVASHRKAARIKQELLESGCDASRVNAIRAPAGLDITAVTPEEVAVSILAEMIQFRRTSLPPAKTMTLEDDGSKVLVEVVSQASCGDPDAE